MSRPLQLTESQWMKIYHDIAANYPHSVLLVRAKMKEVLGFTSRSHSWLEDDQYHRCIMLDFYNEPKRTMFLLKYSEYLQQGKT